jgi:predicted nucleotidyltransferase
VEQLDLLKRVAALLDSLGVPYMIVGSYGSTVYGEPRFTNDIDIVADLPPSAVPEIVAAFPVPEFYLSEDAVRAAIKDRFQFNVLHPASGNKVDVIVPQTNEWARTQLNRRRELMLDGGFVTYAASPEDVIVGKLWYYSIGGSDKHLRDIAGMLRVGGEAIDRATVARWAAALGYSDIWEAVVRSVDTPTNAGS